MLNKRIASILVAGMVMVSMVGCQSSKEQQLEQRVQQLEQQLEEQEQQEKEKEELNDEQKQELESKNLTVKERKQLKQIKQSGKKVQETKDYVVIDGKKYSWDEFEKALTDELTKELIKEGSKQDNNTNSDVDERNNYKPADNNYDEDYWKTDGDLPEEQTTEPEGAYTEPADNNNISVEEQQGSDQGANIPDEQPQQDYNSEE